MPPALIGRQLSSRLWESAIWLRWLALKELKLARLVPLSPPEQ
jgi:hypothetical protein